MAVPNALAPDPDPDRHAKNHHQEENPDHGRDPEDDREAPANAPDPARENAAAPATRAETGPATRAEGDPPIARIPETRKPGTVGRPAVTDPARRRRRRANPAPDLHRDPRLRPRAKCRTPRWAATRGWRLNE